MVIENGRIRFKMAEFDRSYAIPSILPL